MQELVRGLMANLVTAKVVARQGEMKLAQTADFCVAGEPWRQALARSSASVVVLGIASDIGVRANFGKPGCGALWSATWPQLLNMQDNATLRGDSILVLGEIVVDDFVAQAEQLNAHIESDRASLCDLVSQVHERVCAVVTEVLKSGKMLVAVGGGHENAFGILKGLSQATDKAVACINIDAHADLRVDDGRHSGNAFSAAQRENILARYCVLGLQEPYVNDTMWKQLKEDKQLCAITLENIRARIHSRSDKLRKLRGISLALQSAGHIRACEEARQFVKKRPLALEMDLDAITGVPASAPTPSGLSTQEVREMLYSIATHRDVSTFHICEGIPGEADTHGVGKLAALLIQDVVKATLARRA